MVANKVVRWHKMPFVEYVKYEASRDMFRPFVYGGIASFVICGVLPARGASQEDKEKSNFWKRTHGKFDHSHAH